MDCTGSTAVTLFRMGLFRTTHEWRGSGNSLLKMFYTYPVMIKIWLSYTPANIRHLEHVFSVTFFLFQDDFKTSSKRVARRLLEDVLKWEDILQTLLEDVLKDVLKMSFEDILRARLKTSWKMKDCDPEDVLENKKCLLGP